MAAESPSRRSAPLSERAGSVGPGAVLYDQRAPSNRRCCGRGGRCLAHVRGVYEDTSTDEVYFRVSDGTHTTEQWIHEGDLLALFEPAGWSIDTGVKPTYVLTRRHGVEDHHDLMTDGGIDREQPKNHVSVFPYPGGKGRRAEWILEKMPPHDTFVDVFGGSGAIIYNKPPSTNEIYNDVNDDLVQFFEVLRNRPEELESFVRNIPYARSVYDEWADAFFNGYRPNDPIERAGRFWALRYMQFAGDMSMVNSLKVRAKRSPARTFDNARDRLQELANRFSDVILENRDYSRILDTYDDTDVDVLFYCDPPYVDTEHYYGAEFDHGEFVDALRNVESEWMVSYAELPDGLDDLGYVLSRNRRHRMCREASDSTEHLVCSFDPTDSSRFLGGGLTQQRFGVIE
jgi:DNA adenine methylase